MGYLHGPLLLLIRVCHADDDSGVDFVVEAQAMISAMRELQATAMPEIAAACEVHRRSIIQVFR